MTTGSGPVHQDGTLQPREQHLLADLLADLFPDKPLAADLVARAGLSPGRTPGFTVDQSRLFWSAVVREFSLGAVHGGLVPLVKAVVAERPHNPDLLAWAARFGVARPAVPPPGVDPPPSPPAPRTRAFGPDGYPTDAFPVFVSYTHQSDPAGVLEAFLEQLRDVVSTRLGTPRERTLFVDTTLRAGGAWSARIMDALAYCRVFVPVYATAYAGSEYCGREWTAFARRLRAHASATGQHADAIIPVLWTGVGDISRWVGREPFEPIQYADGGADKEPYRRRGILGIPPHLRHTVAFDLAERIRDARWALESVPPGDPTIDRAVFDALPAWESP